MQKDTSSETEEKAEEPDKPTKMLKQPSSKHKMLRKNTKHALTREEWVNIFTGPQFNLGACSDLLEVKVKQGHFKLDAVEEERYQVAETILKKSHILGHAESTDDPDPDPAGVELLPVLDAKLAFSGRSPQKEAVQTPSSPSGETSYGTPLGGNESRAEPPSPAVAVHPALLMGEDADAIPSRALGSSRPNLMKLFSTSKKARVEDDLHRAKGTIKTLQNDLRKEQRAREALEAEVKELWSGFQGLSQALEMKTGANTQIPHGRGSSSRWKIFGSYSLQSISSPCSTPRQSSSPLPVKLTETSEIPEAQHSTAIEIGSKIKGESLRSESVCL
ncbi:hypothetical protein CYMTET_15284 [Cymbomonas tetramitiformis]|uniref:Uncharacterized protein n=1 Tax=Cymbomonas tetramitiformis TaxID=36881 RepID=A0AAE0GEC2_9CHLO|nr:hypothetical protein CYMTET_15284 [Cymbomonas tetramitiformis]